MNTAPYTLTLVFCDENMPRMHYNARDKTDAQAQGAHWLKQFASIKYLKVSNHAALETSYYDATGAHLFTAPLPKKESTP